jgi:hypothetical protein
MALIPTELTLGRVPELNDRIRSVREGIILAVAEIQSGSVPVRRTLGTLPGDLLDLAVETKREVERSVVPPDRQEDFEDGSAALNEFASFDGMDYYNGLIKLERLARGLLAALVQVRDDDTVQLYASSVGAYLSVLTEEQFEDDNLATERETGYSTAALGEMTALELAASAYGDPARFPELLDANPEIFDSFDPANENLTVRVPRDPSAISGTNQVYEPFYSGTDSKLRERWLFGRSLRLTPISDFGGMALSLSPTGALALSEGRENLLVQLQLRLRNRSGSLVLHPEWGFAPVLETGDPIVDLDRLLEEYRAQMEADPRVGSARVDHSTLRVAGDAYRANMRLELIGDSSAGLEVTA